MDQVNRKMLASPNPMPSKLRDMLPSQQLVNKDAKLTWPYEHDGAVERPLDQENPPLWVSNHSIRAKSEPFAVDEGKR